MIRFLKILIVILIWNHHIHAQEKFTISGTITEAKSNETLIGVNILFPEIGKGVVTNEYGFYSITLPKNSYKLQVSYVGFNSINQQIELNENQKLNFQLTEASEM